MKKINILIADDHPIVREGLKQIISETDDMMVADEAGNGREVLDLVRKKEYDLLLLDISMPGRSGLEILKELKSEYPKLPVLILSIYPEEQYAVRAKKIVNGGRYVSESLAEKLTYYLDEDSSRPPHDLLTDREYQVMLMLGSGKTVKEVAEELFLSVKTISTYRTHILEKMKMKNNAEVTLYVVKNKLVD
ncbi:MAG: response regulator transcription factor [Deltaproteobacteria bacterium]|nr:response regulator transcription factor [Deltaproteobacteria bacterium]